MSEKHIVVQGATCKCKFSVEPKLDKLKVLSQTKHYGNDKDGSKKLIASDKDIGQTLEKNTFGKCKKQPVGNDYLPCMAQITKWSGFYEKMTLSNKGKVLLEDSKGTCPMGAPDCIEITKHGQVTEPGEQNFKNANPMVHNLINPMVDVRDMYKKQAEHKGLVDNDGEVKVKGNGYYSMAGEYIGTDEIEDNLKFMAINKATQRELEKQAKSGKIKINIESENPGLFLVVSQAEIDAMVSLYNKTENDLIEVGMVGGTTSSKERVFAVDINGNGNDIFHGTADLVRELNSKHYPMKIEYNVHTHPPIFKFISTDNEGNDVFKFGINTASQADIHGSLSSYKIAVVLGWEIDREAEKLDNIVVQKAKKSPNSWFRISKNNIKYKKIDFYNNRGDIGEINFSDFIISQRKARDNKI